MKKIKVTLKKSLICCSRQQKACAKGLGLKKINSYSVLTDTVENCGMANKINHLISIEEIPNVG